MLGIIIGVRHKLKEINQVLEKELVWEIARLISIFSEVNKKTLIQANYGSLSIFLQLSSF